jgi:hypothetical protein
MTESDWERRLTELWASFDDHDEPEFLARMQELLGELPADSPVGLFERAGSLDSTGDSEGAVLALVDTGAEREAISLSLAALAPHLPRYQRSLAAYAADLSQSPDGRSA